MKNQISSVAAPCAVAGNHSSLSQNSLFNHLIRTTKKTFSRLEKVFWAVCFLQFLGLGAMAQNYDTLNVFQVGFGISAPKQTLNQGETASIAVSLGNQEQQISGAVAFSIELELDSRVTFPLNPQVSVANSWFFDGSSMGLVVETEPSERIVRIKGNRPAGEDGYGLLFNIELTAGNHGLSAGHMVKQGGGVVIITVDDIGFKMAQVVADPVTEQAVMYPNPCRGQVNFNWGDRIPEMVQVFDLKTHLVATLSPAEMQEKRWTTDGLPFGLYQVVLLYENGDYLAKPLIVE